MMRAVWLVMLCAGCDVVLGFELPGPPTHDEDGDLVADHEDPCPHIANESTVDVDGDGIPADCDVDDNVPSTGRFFSFTDGDHTGLRLAAGSVEPADDAIVFGAPANESFLVFDVDTGTVLVDLGFEIGENGVESGDEPWAEIGIVTAHESAASDEHGSWCMFGRDAPPGEGYLEFHENEVLHTSPKASFAAPFAGQAGRLRHVRTTERTDCTVIREQGSVLAGGFANERNSQTGAVAIESSKARARLRYLWIVHPAGAR